MEDWTNYYNPIDPKNMLPVGDPLYPGSDVCVAGVFTDSTECVVYHTRSGTVGQGLDKSSSFQENLVTALLDLLYCVRYKAWLKENGHSMGKYGVCFVCESRGEYRYAFRVSEDWEILYCPVCENYHWVSLYSPARKGIPFELKGSHGTTVLRGCCDDHSRGHTTHL